MNSTSNLFIHLYVYVTLFFGIGMVKPNWALFFLKKPNQSRLFVVYATTLLLMIVTTFFGSWNKERVLQEKKVVENAVSVSEIPEAK